MKRMDRPSAIEMDRGGVYEMDRQTKCQKMQMPLIWIKLKKIKKIIIGQVLECVIAFYPFQWHFPFLALFLSIHFIEISSFHFCDTSSTLESLQETSNLTSTPENTIPASYVVFILSGQPNLSCKSLFLTPACCQSYQWEAARPTLIARHTSLAQPQLVTSPNMPLFERLHHPYL